MEYNCENELGNKQEKYITTILIKELYINDTWIKMICEKTKAVFEEQHPMLGYTFKIPNYESFFEFCKYGKLALNYFNNADNKNMFIAKFFHHSDSIINPIERKTIIEMIDTNVIDQEKTNFLEWLKQDM